MLLNIRVECVPETFKNAIRIVQTGRDRVAKSIELNHLAIDNVTRLEAQTHSIDHSPPGHSNDHVRFQNCVDEVRCSCRSYVESFAGGEASYRSGHTVFQTVLLDESRRHSHVSHLVWSDPYLHKARVLRPSEKTRHCRAVSARRPTDRLNRSAGQVVERRHSQGVRPPIVIAGGLDATC